MTTRKTGCGSQLTRTSSTSCRDRHLKCDREEPQCTNCAKSRKKRICVYGELKLRHSEYSAPEHPNTIERVIGSPDLSLVGVVSRDNGLIPGKIQYESASSPVSSRLSAYSGGEERQLFVDSKASRVEDTIFQFYKSCAGTWLFKLRGSRNKWSPHENDLAAVSFWVYVREGLRLCFLNEEKCLFDIHLVEEETTYGEASEEAWTKRATYLLARARNLCFGDEYTGTRGQEENMKLEKYLSMWNARIPETFRPWSNKAKQFGLCPAISFLSTWHEVAWQQYFAAKVLVAVHRVKTYSLTNILALNNYLENYIRDPARKLAGICFKTSDVGSQINGSHLVSWCGQYFTEAEERKILSGWLERMMNETKWPNKSCAQRLEGGIAIASHGQAPPRVPRPRLRQVRLLWRTHEPEPFNTLLSIPTISNPCPYGLEF
ncbi:hypothetical protein ABEF95_014697 [Exophiala dermatitidis]